MDGWLGRDGGGGLGLWGGGMGGGLRGLGSDLGLGLGLGLWLGGLCGCGGSGDERSIRVVC